MNYPRLIDPVASFEVIVDWLHRDVIIARESPGFLVGLSGTDSIVTFLAAYRAAERDGQADRVWGVHFAPSEDFIADHPETETHLWFAKDIIPWLREQAPQAKIEVNTSVDWRADGLRWGWLADRAAIATNDDDARTLLHGEERYWVVGTRNKTEDALYTYSNASRIASVQPLIGFWKSEVLQIANYLEVPRAAMVRSCEADCLCGRDQLQAKYVREIDLLLMMLVEEEIFPALDIPEALVKTLKDFIQASRLRGGFKSAIPYDCAFGPMEDVTVSGFEQGTIRGFNHQKHLYVAWYYLKAGLPVKAAIERYSFYLRQYLAIIGKPEKFSATITEAYFNRLASAMKATPGAGFEQLLALVSLQ